MTKAEREAMTKAETFQALTVFAVIVGLLVWGIGCLSTFSDSDYWMRIDADGECYVHVEEVNNAWLTPGDESELRNTYCQKS